MANPQHGARRMPACPCHRELLLNAQQARALELLAGWLQGHAPTHISSGLLRGGREGNHIYNQVQASFPSTPRPAVSSLAYACHLAGFDAQPGAERGTSLESDLGEILRRYDAGERLTETAMKSAREGSRLFNRVKKRAGRARGRTSSWMQAVLMLLELRPTLDVRRFFTNLPPGYVLDGKGHLIPLRDQSDDELRRVAVELFRARAAEGYAVNPTSVQEEPELRALIARLRNHKIDIVPLMMEATGRTLEAITHDTNGARVHKIQNHSACIDPVTGGEVLHRPLRSRTEAMVDECFAHFAGPCPSGGRA